MTATVVTSLIGLNPLSVFAADPEVGGENMDGGSATISGSATTGGEDTTLAVDGDEDEVDSTTDTAGQNDINVWAKISGSDGNDIIYSISVDWGNMQFVYDWGGSWDAESHTYTTSGESGGATTAGWISTYVNGTQNKITVTNDSNYPVTSKFAYANTLTEIMEAGEGTGTYESAFNVTPTENGSVTGIFADDNDTLSANINAEGYNGVGDTNVETVNTASFDLATSDTLCEVQPTGLSETDIEDSVYFSLCGTPDSGKTISNFASVGIITVTITPYTAE